MNALEVENLTKRYPSFMLNKVSFSVGEGRICGLIGRNGAGKSTTIKAALNFIQSEGEVRAFGVSLKGNERAVKELVGYAGGGFRFYPQKTVGQIGKTVSGFYGGWNEGAFAAYLSRFSLDARKKTSELSEGMRVKLSLALALSHGARLLVLDEPTSGLDPLSREEVCDLLLSLARDEGVSVLFSTHITSDLERAADDIVYLSHGRVRAAEPLSSLCGRYRRGIFESEETAKRAGALGIKRVKNGFAGLLEAGGAPACAELAAPTLDEIIIHLETEGNAA